MTRARRFAELSKRPLAGLVAAALLVLGPGASLLAAEAARAVEAPPRLEVASYDPLPGALRKRVPDSVEELRAIEQRVTSLIEDLRAVTVGIRRGPAQGTGVIVSEDGYVLTAAHVSGRPGRPVTVILNDGTELNGVALGRHTGTDAGLVKITDAGRWPVAKVGDLRHLKQGDWVIGTGHPGGLTTDRLPVIRLGRVIANMKWIIHTDVTLVGGDSGGPLFDLNGRVVGIHSRIGPGAELNFHVPITAYTDNWYWMLASEDRPTEPEEGGPVLGVDGTDVKEGCRVTRVFEGRPADLAGLREGDVITRIDHRFVFGLEDLISSVNQYYPGQSIQISYRRDGEQHTARVTLGERRPTGQ